ncbi:MAG: YmdB family metallophosphoesterase [Phycisphaerae bacterium]
MVNILCVGDVVGSPGRRVLAQALPRLADERDIHCNVVNVENVASGSGLTPALYKKMLACGAHLMTLGDHVFRRKEIIPTLEESKQIVRPANLPAEAPGRCVAIYQTQAGHKVAVVALLGRLFINQQTDCPYRTIDRILKTIPPDVRIIVVDMHAEATSEKIAMGWHLDGRVSILFGTHTHVPTADERILPQGTAYITDLGMTGPYDSVLGRSKERVLGAILSAVPMPFNVATDDVRLCGIAVTVDPATGKAQSIERVRADWVEDGSAE